MSWRTRRTFRWLGYAAVAVALVVAVNYLLSRRIDPKTVPQSTWHAMATASSHGTLDPLPKEHEVVIEPLAESPALVLMSYLPAPIGSGGAGEIQGAFDTKSGAIHVKGRMARLQASLPFDWARPLLRRTLRHEYGHAFAYDYLKSNDDKFGGEAFMGLSEGGEKIKPEAYPKALRPVAKEFARLESDVYGPTYFTQSFDEYLAESYARFVAGKSVPPKTAAFLSDACQE